MSYLTCAVLFGICLVFVNATYKHEDDDSSNGGHDWYRSMTDGSSGKSGHSGGSSGKSGHNGGSSGKSGNDEGSSGKSGHDKGSSGKSGDDKGSSGKSGHDGGSSGKSGDDKGSSGKNGNDEGSSGKSGHDGGSSGKSGHDGGSSGKSGNDEGSSGKSGHDKGSSGKSGNNEGSSRKSGDDKGSSGKSGHDEGSSGKSGDDKGSSGKSGDDKGSSGKSGHDKGSSGKSGHNGGSSGKSGDKGSSGKSGDDKGSSGKSGHDGGSSGKSGDDKGSSGKSGHDGGSSGKSGDDKGSSGKSGHDGGSSGKSEHDKGSSGKSGHGGGSSGKSGNDKGSSGKSGHDEGSSGKSGHDEGSSGKSGDDKGSSGKSGDDKGSSGKSGHDGGSSGKSGDKGSSGKSGDDKGSSGKSGHDGGSSGKSGDDKGSSGKSGHDGGSSGKSGDDKGSSGKSGHDGGSSGKSEHDKGSSGKSGHGGGSSGKSGNDKGSSGKSGNNEGSSGKGGHDGGSSGKSGNDGGSSGKSGHDKGSSGKSGHDKGSSGKSGNDNGSSGKSGNDNGSSDSKSSKDGSSIKSISRDHSTDSKSGHGMSSDSSSEQRFTCKLNGETYNVGKIADPEKPCEMCICLPNGTIRCVPKMCPKPRCGLDLQRPSSDGCCVMCDPKCQIKPCTRHLPCPVSKQVYRNGSCCPECNTGCEYGGSKVPVGMIADPMKPCETCICLPNGTAKCIPKMCPKPRCGLDLQRQSSDGCCVTCDPKCQIKPCTRHLPCPVSKQVYRKGSCCPECNTGCEYGKSRVPVGMIADPKKPCEMCICLPNGTAKCIPKMCPKPRCGLDLQRPSSDGCCVMCDPKCLIKPCTRHLPCPVSKQVYRNGSCCPECNTGCEYGGSRVPVGMIADPKKPCETCICLPNGTAKCIPKMCPKPRCGLDLQRQSSDGCCVTCDPKCQIKPCTRHLPCPVSKQVYRKGSCCPECNTGCEYGKSRVPVGMIADPKKPCEMCICLPNGTAKCIPKMCPKPRCGLDLQRLSSDGCCVTCDPKCQVKPCTRHLPCPVSKQVYRSGSCCPECNTGCDYGGSRVPVGMIADPKKPCETCICLPNGTAKCIPKMCPKPRCGLDLQRQSSDECCVTCDPKCQIKPCTRHLPCPVSKQVYRKGSCCPECNTGCEYGKSRVPVGMIADSKKPCEMCICLPNGTAKCIPKMCPKPRCGLDLQRPSSDGCCVMCDPKCQIKPCTRHLPCPVSKQVYRNGSCCPECNTGCEYGGSRVPVGMIADPKKPCEMCICLPNGTAKCIPKMCPKPRCGLDLQRPSSDGCCITCDPKCQIKPCTRHLPCPVSKQVYRKGSCCPECNTGCEYDGSRVPVGMIADPKKPCETCICLPDGTTKCIPKMCPKPRCGLDLQRQSSDGCCVTCDPKCQIKPCTRHLPCPVSKQVYRKGSCCPECNTGCEYGKSKVPVGMIVDQKKPCETCICLPNGTVKCVPKMCPRPRCGLDLQRPSSDGCCVTCDPKCQIKPCTRHLPCPVTEQVYRNGSCCPECNTGCEYDGSFVPIGMIADPKKPCEMCLCLPNGKVNCVPKICPKPRCGLDLQRPSSDECCVMCDPKCYIKPCTLHLPCPVTKQVYRNGSCCPECDTGCKYGGSRVPVGMIDDPKKPCEMCMCFPNSTVKCVPQICLKPRCGSDLQRPSSDGCCVMCDPKCNGIMCTRHLPCPVSKQVYRKGSCCLECDTGCKYQGARVPVGLFENPKNPCEICRCLADGSVKCELKPCDKPQCSLDLQVKSEDGCCVTCHPKCNPEYPCNTKLPCPPSNQMSRKGSCCPECVCKYQGNIVSIGSFENPKNPCEICRCLADGSVKCELKPCDKPQCSLDLQVKSEDGCCVTCHPKCNSEYPCNTKLPCSPSNQMSRKGSCCPECVCKYQGNIVSIGSFENPKNPCEICRCLADGSVKCELKPCDKPQCSLDLQVKSEDGCCVTCHPKCNREYPCNTNLPCPPSNQMFRKGSCCPECVCKYEGTIVPVGKLATNPNQPCQVCECFENGKVECSPKACGKPKCGIDFHVKSEDGCCTVCDRRCDGAVLRRELDCPISNQFYGNSSCLPECGCNYKGNLVPLGPTGHPCDECECRADTFQVTCDRQGCPKKRPECVDPVYDSKCEFVCPFGRTCLYKGNVIKPGQFLKVGKMMCTCLKDRFYPEAFCTKTKLSKTVKELQKSKCIAKPAKLSSKKKKQ